jgi:hypothetical protein
VLAGVIQNHPNRSGPDLGENLFVVLLVMAPSSQELEPPANPGRFAHTGAAFFAYSDNYLIDVKFGVIVDVDASRSIRQAEVGAAKTMIERTEERFGLKPERLVGDTAYGAAPMLNWLVEDKGIAPHIPVFDKSKRDDGTFSRSDFRYDPTIERLRLSCGQDPDDDGDTR